MQKAGYPVVVNDVRREAAARHIEAGATWADTPRAVAEQTEVIFSCLPNLTAIEVVAFGTDGILAGVRRGQALFEMSTSSPELVARLHASQSAKRSCSMRRSVGVPAARSAGG